MTSPFELLFVLGKGHRYKCRHCGKTYSYGMLTRHLVEEHPELGTDWLRQKGAFEQNYEMIE